MVPLLIQIPDEAEAEIGTAPQRPEDDLRGTFYPSAGEAWDRRRSTQVGVNSWVGNAGIIGGVSIYRGSNQRPLAREAACLSNILTKVLTILWCSAVQIQLRAAQRSMLMTENCKQNLHGLCRPKTRINR